MSKLKGTVAQICKLKVKELGNELQKTLHWALRSFLCTQIFIPEVLCDIVTCASHSPGHRLHRPIGGERVIPLVS